jgi:hypothetical protein
MHLADNFAKAGGDDVGAQPDGTAHKRRQQEGVLVQRKTTTLSPEQVAQHFSIMALDGLDG